MRINSEEIKSKRRFETLSNNNPVCQEEIEATWICCMDLI